MARICELIVPAEISRALIEKARKAKEEICGVFVGKVVCGVAIVKDEVQLENIKHSRTLFEMSPQQLFEVFNVAKQRGLEVVALYHSHFGDAKPSTTDKKYMQLWDIPWVIIGTGKAVIKAYMYLNDAGIVVEVPVIIR